MVQEIVTYQVQQALVQQLDKRFDGDAYIGGVQNPKFVVDFFANDPDVLSRNEVQEFIENFSPTYDGRAYDVTIEAVPERGYKYQFILKLESADN